MLGELLLDNIDASVFVARSQRGRGQPVAVRR